MKEVEGCQRNAKPRLRKEAHGYRQLKKMCRQISIPKKILSEHLL